MLPRMAEVWLRDPRRLRADPRFALQKAALHARSIVGLLPQMADVWLRDPRRLRADPGFICAILGLLLKSSVRGLRSKIL